jgi:hypothetical protein
MNFLVFQVFTLFCAQHFLHKRGAFATKRKLLQTRVKAVRKFGAISKEKNAVNGTFKRPIQRILLERWVTHSGRCALRTPSLPDTEAITA